jgi:pimeloyl-ACP methyl ester carboxylesterase
VIQRYDILEIASDVVALADAIGFQKFHLIGHDWGAGCGWTVIERYPDRIVSWSALSIPHMAAFRAAKLTDPDQKRRSWYMTFFQIPIIPELLFGCGVTQNRRSLWQFSSEAEVADYLTVFRGFAGRRATINWYRANHNFPVEYASVSVPTLLIWGNQDIAVGRTSVEMAKAYMTGNYTMIELDAGHSLVQEQFERVNQAILNHLQRHSLDADRQS